MHQQHTLKQSVSCEGVGLHSGVMVSLTIHPAPINTGIVFVRIDGQLESADSRIPALWSYVSDTRLCTRLSNSAGVSIGTIEHLMAALSAMAVDNAEIHVNSSELPIMDGSAGPFVTLIKAAGLLAQNAPRRFVRVLKPVVLEHDGRKVALHPSDMNLSVDYTWRSERQDCLISGAYQVSDIVEQFSSEIAQARTFGFLEDVEMLQSNGLARGGSLANSVVIDGARVLNPEGLRYADECLRHKVLDAIGDLYLAGAPLIAKFVCVGSGHDLNHKVLAALMADTSSWESITQPLRAHPNKPKNEVPSIKPSPFATKMPVSVAVQI